ncbi:MAG: hypothetical protein AB7V46_07915 [Thermomicrobiales bacterium]
MGEMLRDSEVPPAEAMAETPVSLHDPATGEDAESTSVWIPSGRSLREELMQPRYLALAIVAVLAIVLQLWLLY